MNRNFGDTRILSINLSSEESRIEYYPTLTELFFGGRGVNQGILLEKGIDRDERGIPRRLVFGPGSLAGSLAPAATRSNIDSGNMFNAGIGSGSIGGRIGPYLRFAGYDHLVLEGRATKPKYILIEGERASLKDASALWGKTISQTDEILRSRYPKAAILYIGPAGENLVRMASIHSDLYRTQGRCGLGMILGAMKIKAIVIPETSGQLIVKDPKAFNTTAQIMFQKIRSQKEMLNVLSSAGLTGSMGTWLPLQNPVRNYQDVFLTPEVQEKLGSSAYEKLASKSAETCLNCPINCDVVLTIKDGPYIGTTWAGVEGNVQWDFGSRLGIDDIETTIKLHQVCTDLGLDADSTSVAIAWAFECYQRGVLHLQDTDGLALEWGNGEAALELLWKIARREGCGDLLAEGCKKAAEKVGQGSLAWAMQVKGQDLAEPLRAEIGWALGVVVSPRGGSHTRGAPLPFATPPMTEPYDPISYEGQANRVVLTEKLHAMADCLGLCIIPSQWACEAWPGLKDYAELYCAASGREFDLEDVLKRAEDVVSLEKIFNQIHAGFSRSDDYPPDRSINEAIPSGPYKGQKLSIPKWDKMLDEYYKLHGWDIASGQIEEHELSRILDSIRQAIKGTNPSPDFYSQHS